MKPLNGFKELYVEDGVLYVDDKMVSWPCCEDKAFAAKLRIENGVTKLCVDKHGDIYECHKASYDWCGGNNESQFQCWLIYGAPLCPRCDGKGEVFLWHEDSGAEKHAKCLVCEGRGVVITPPQDKNAHYYWTSFLEGCLSKIAEEQLHDAEVNSVYY